MNTGDAGKLPHSELDDEALEPPKKKKRNRSPSTPPLTRDNRDQLVIERAHSDEYRRVALTLVLAFYHDPFLNFILKTRVADVYGGRSRKRSLFTAYFEYAVWECLALDGVIWVVKDPRVATTDDHTPFVAAALWNRIYSGRNYEEEYLSLAQNLRHWSFVNYEWKTLVYNCRARLNKCLRVLYERRNELLETHHVLDAQDCTVWYLNDFGTLPEAQGLGIGTRLIRHSMPQLPSTWVYLESSNPENRGFYRKMGFEVMSSYSVKYDQPVSATMIDPSAVVVDAMIRCPVA
ncbi:hypothetical protein DICA3_F37280 [Diutina catenulata]